MRPAGSLFDSLAVTHPWNVGESCLTGPEDLVLRLPGPFTATMQQIPQIPPDAKSSPVLSTNRRSLLGGNNGCKFPCCTGLMRLGCWRWRQWAAVKQGFALPVTAQTDSTRGEAHAWNSRIGNQILQNLFRYGGRCLIFPKIIDCL